MTPDNESPEPSGTAAAEDRAGAGPSGGPPPAIRSEGLVWRPRPEPNVLSSPPGAESGVGASAQSSGVSGPTSGTRLPPTGSGSATDPGAPQNQTRRSFLAGLLAGVAGGVAGGAGAAWLLRDDNSAGGTAAAPTSASGGAAAGPLTLQQTSAIIEVAAKARPGIVRIDSTRRASGGGLETEIGSGVILDVAGHILTNAHVVIGAETVKVTLADGTERAGILLAHDMPYTDVAVLQIGPGKLTLIPVGDSEKLVLGQTVVAIGNPLAEFDGSVSVGVVSGLNRKRVFDAVRQDDLIQTDAAVNNGNSGGALLNLEGQFVGMPTAIIRQPPRGGGIVEGIAFALPSKRLMAIATKIISDGSYPRPSLGLDHDDLPLDGTNRARIALEDGALVLQVSRGGAAEAAGIAVNDVITRLGDQDVNRGAPLFNALLHYEPGQTVKVVLNRNGRIIETEVRLGKRT